MRANRRRIVLALVRAGAGQLIGLRGRDGADEKFQVELVVGELLGQQVEQFGMAGGAVAADHLVDRLDQAGAEEVGPDAVDGGAGEVGIVRAR